jgi:hypothetical protein
VLFTRNPVTGADEIVVEATWGLGEAIVQGLVIPDRYRIARNGEVLEQTSGIKQLAVRQHPDGQTHQQPVARELAEKPCLDNTQLHSLYQLAARCDDVYGADPHDIEWAFQAHTPHLLQRRPITTSLLWRELLDAALNDDQREATSSNDNHRSGNRPSDDPIHRHLQVPPSSANSVVRTIGILYVRCESDSDTSIPHELPGRGMPGRHPRSAFGRSERSVSCYSWIGPLPWLAGERLPAL